MTMERLLQLLADGEFHSGRALGEQLNISRSAVWKQIQRLQALGIEVYSVKGRGYRIPHGIELLDRQAFESRLPETVAQRLSLVEFHREVDSTNRLALDALRLGAPNALIAAEYQSQGRGRRGRTWISPYGSNLCFSMGWRFSAGVSALEGLSLSVGLALRNALVRLGGQGINLKWPNDLLVAGRKLGGILIEVRGDAAGECEAVIGAGLNVALPDTLPEAIDQPITDLTEVLGERPSRNGLLALIVEELLHTLDHFEQQGFAGMREQWQSANAHQNAPVRLIAGTQEVRGICRGVDASGALLLENEGRIEAYHGGEISVRAME